MAAKTWDEVYGEGAESKGQSQPLADLSAIDTMDADSLRKLIRSVSSVIWGYALMDDTQKAEAARLKLYSMGMSAKEVYKVVPALDKWFDRSLGKAHQSIALDVKDDRKQIAIEDLILLASKMREPVIIPPMPVIEQLVD